MIRLLNKHLYDVSETAAFNSYFHLSNNVIQYINHGYILASVWLICIFMTFVFHLVPRGRNHSLSGLSVSYFSPCCDKTVGNDQLRKEELISAHGQVIIL